MFRVNNYQLGALVKSTPTDKIIEQNRIDPSHTEITYLFETDNERMLTEYILQKKGIFKGFKRN